MRLLHELSEFKIPSFDMVIIYISSICSLCEQYCQVWLSSLILDDSDKLERVQKVALKIILAENYISLNETKLEKLSKRREELCLSFAQKCLKNETTQNMFPLNPVRENARNHEKYQVFHSNNCRLYNSAIPFMQRLLNSVN